MPLLLLLLAGFLLHTRLEFRFGFSSGTSLFLYWHRHLLHLLLPDKRPKNPANFSGLAVEGLAFEPDYRNVLFINQAVGEIFIKKF